MEVNETLVRQITEAVVRELQMRDYGGKSGTADGNGAGVKGGIAGGSEPDTALPDKIDYHGYPQAKQGTDPKEVVIGVGAAFGTVIKHTITGIPVDKVIKAIIAGIEEEGMTARVVKNLKTSDVCFIGLEAAKLSGSGFGIGLQSKGTAVIHHKALYPLSNLELFPQAP